MDIPAPSTINPVSPRAAQVLPPSWGIKNAVNSSSNPPNFPLQGIMLFVSTAMSFSRGDSIIRQPVTPTALQPSPMHMVSPIFPQLPQTDMAWSRLYATRGR